MNIHDETSNNSGLWTEQRFVDGPKQKIEQGQWLESNLTSFENIEVDISN